MRFTHRVPPKQSAGLLVFRRGASGELEVLLGHMGGPFWARKDDRAWSIPKGEHPAEEDALAAARREFAEELGHHPPAGEPIDLGTVVQSNRKHVRAFAIEGNLDVSSITSNTFETEWPPRSGRRERFPEIDRAAWFDLQSARGKVVKGQEALLERLAERASGSSKSR